MRRVNLAACFLFYGTNLSVSVIFVNIHMVNGQNIALGKPTKQSSDFYLGNIPQFSYLAVDGSTSNQHRFDIPGCTHTENELNSWWSVDLGAIYLISRVIIWGRKDCCIRRLSSFSIDAAMPVKPHKCGPYQFGTWTDFDKGEISECYYQKVKVDFLNATCQQNTVGQFVRIQLDKTNPLTLCEVEIFGRQLPSVYIGVNGSYKCGASGHRIEVDVSRTAVARSIIECVYMCSVRPGCYASNYNKATQGCQLQVAEKEGNPLANMVEDLDWDVFGCL
ncbi:fucolectin-1-like [Mytilus edulis]|uniref:fucolectin-1-like n=1 Tax=Mytilus edulis TaxID=6550 RepID=UPI0039EED648